MASVNIRQRSRGEYDWSVSCANSFSRPTSGPQSEGVTEHSDAVQDLIILQETRGEADNTNGTTTISQIEFGNSISTFLSPAEYNKSKEDTYQPENLEDLYQDITKNVLRKIVKIRNLKNAIVKV